MDDSETHKDLPAPARRFTTPEIEAVIRRAVQLHAGHAERKEDGISDVELMRIGQEIGLDAATVRRAMAEARVRPPELDRGALVRLAGARTARVARVVPLPADGAASQLDEYLRETQLMIAQRRFPDRTRYALDSSLAANVARMARGFARSHQPLKLQELDVAVSAIDADSCLVELSVDLAGMRGGIIAGVLGSSSALAGAWATVTWVTAIADPMMLLGIPLVAGAWFGTRAIYGTVYSSVEEKLESLLDRLEHNDL